MTLLKSIECMITVSKVQTEVSYYKNICKFCDNGYIFTSFLAQTECSDRLSNFKLCTEILIITTPWKGDLFHKEKKNVIGALIQKQWLNKDSKKILMWPRKKYLTYYFNCSYTNEDYLHQKTYDSWHWINFYLIWGPNKSKGQTDKL